MPDPQRPSPATRHVPLIGPSLSRGPLARLLRNPTVQIAIRLIREADHDDLHGLAAELAYRFFLSLIPFLIFAGEIGVLLARLAGVADPAHTILWCGCDGSGWFSLDIVRESPD